MQRIAENGRDGFYSEEDTPNPISQYGMTKLLGEQEILEADYSRDVIIRTTVLYGGCKPDFVGAILRQLKEKSPFEVTGLVVGSPTYIPHLSKGIKALVRLKRPPRIVNIAGKDVISRWAFACMIAKEHGFSKRYIQKVLTDMWTARVKWFDGWQEDE